jgi:hypothetical protein
VHGFNSIFCALFQSCALFQIKFAINTFKKIYGYTHTCRFVVRSMWSMNPNFLNLRLPDNLDVDVLEKIGQHRSSIHTVASIFTKISYHWIEIDTDWHIISRCRPLCFCLEYSSISAIWAQNHLMDRSLLGTDAQTRIVFASSAPKIQSGCTSSIGQTGGLPAPTRRMRIGFSKSLKCVMLLPASNRQGCCLLYPGIYEFWFEKHETVETQKNTQNAFLTLKLVAFFWNSWIFNLAKTHL